MLNSLPVRSVRLRSTCSEDAQEDVGRLASSSCVVMMGPPRPEIVQAPSPAACLLAGLATLSIEGTLHSANLLWPGARQAWVFPTSYLVAYLGNKGTVIARPDGNCCTAAGTVDGSDGGAHPANVPSTVPAKQRWDTAGMLDTTLSDSCPSGRQHSAQRCPASDSCRSCLVTF